MKTKDKLKLYIDTSIKEKIIIGLNDERFETESEIKKGQKLLPFIDEILKSKNLKIEDITSIDLNQGPGSYTGLRVGASVANVIAWLRKIPLEVELKY